jgi:hypothetical protein
MKRKIISAVIYASTAFVLAEWFDALYGGEPLTDYVGLIHLATAGTVLFAAACILSLFTLRVGVVCGLAGGVLSWPYFAIPIPIIPWSKLVSILPYSNWLNVLTAILVLVVSSIYSVSQLRLLLRGPGNSEESKMTLKLVAGLLYAVGIFGLTTWHSIWDLLFRLRYGS